MTISTVPHADVPDVSSYDKPLVSVLIPCFNHQDYVTQTLDSIAASSYGPLELVFIDDASLDKSFEIASTWLDANRTRFMRVVFERHERNRGISKTLNELVSKATGEYITFIASDDMFVVDGIRNQVEHAIEKNATYVFADAILVDEDGALIAPSALLFYGRRPSSMESRRCLAVDVLLNWEMPWTRIFIQAERFRRMGMFDEQLLFEDRDFVVRVLMSGSYTFIPETVYVYRMRRDNRLTPGLDAVDMRVDFQRSEMKNYLNASGLIKFVLGLNMLAGKIRFDKHGTQMRSYVWPIFAIIRRLITWAHLAVMRFSS